MHKSILSASVSCQKETPFTEFHFHPGVNILWGADAEDIVLTLASIFGRMSPKNGKAEIQRNTDTSLSVSITDGVCGVDSIRTLGGGAAQLVKDFHKQRFLNFDNRTLIFDCSDLPAGFLGASDLLLKKLGDTLRQEDDRPLFVCNFLEQLDEAVDLKSVFKALTATGRQVFIAVPHYYNMKQLEEMPYAIHTL